VPQGSVLEPLLFTHIISLFKMHQGLLDVDWLASTKYMNSISSQCDQRSQKTTPSRIHTMPGLKKFLQRPNSPKWNNLSDKTICAKSLNRFKARLDSTTTSRPNLGDLGVIILYCPPQKPLS